MNYDEVPPIEPRSSSAWIAEFPDGTQKLYLFHAEATFLGVHRYVKALNPQFRIMGVWVGELSVVKVANSYCPDGRSVDQDLNLCSL